MLVPRTPLAAALLRDPEACRALAAFRAGARVVVVVVGGVRYRPQWVPRLTIPASELDDSGGPYRR